MHTPPMESHIFSLHPLVRRVEGCETHTMQTNGSTSGNHHKSHIAPPSPRAPSLNRQEDTDIEERTVPPVVAKASREPADISLAAPELKKAAAKLLGQISGNCRGGLGEIVAHLKNMPGSQQPANLGDGSSKSPASGFQLGEGQSRSSAIRVAWEALPIICERGVLTLSSNWSQARPCS
jgi:hypothetical protein